MTQEFKSQALRISFCSNLLKRHKQHLKSKKNSILLIVQSSLEYIKASRLSLMKLKYLNTLSSPALWLVPHLSIIM